MKIYSPNAKPPELFKKNTLKEKVIINEKCNGRFKSIEFEVIKESVEPHGNTVDRFFDFIKNRFYERMKVFFDFEDKYAKEKVTTFDLSNEV